MWTISLRLPDDLLADQAKARRVTKSSLVPERLTRVLHEQPPAETAYCYHLALDLCGTAKGLPEDLADNPGANPPRYRPSVISIRFQVASMPHGLRLPVGRASGLMPYSFPENGQLRYDKSRS